MSQKDKTVQDKLTELADMIAWFNGDSFSLEAALDKFKEAEALAETIENDLKSLRNDIDVVKQKFDSES